MWWRNVEEVEGLKQRQSYFLACILVLIGILAGCGNTTPDDTAVNSSERATKSQDTTKQDSLQESNSKGISKETIKVGVLYISDPDEGSGYSYTHDLGIIGMQDNLDLSADQIERKIVDDGDDEATQTAIEECIADGCNIIFTTSYGYMEATSEMAEKYPDVYFSHATGYLSNGTNFNNYFGRIYQARYLSGIVAGMQTKTNKIGYVAAQGTSSSEVTSGLDAFALGVESVNPDAMVYVVVTNSWYAPEAEEEASRTLLDMDCDVMAQHCDTPYPQTLAQEYGVYGIGYNSDMSKETPDSCLCSVIWNWSAYYTQAVDSIIDGTWDGSNYFGGISDGVVELTNLSELVVDGVQEKVDEATASILDGSFHVFDGVMETNIRDKVGVDGGTLDDATILSGIDWYYHNIVVVE
jgi:basic membrane protein A